MSDVLSRSNFELESPQMKTADEILEFIAERLGVIYLHPRPFCYGGTSESTETLLHYYHEKALLRWPSDIAAIPQKT